MPDDDANLIKRCLDGHGGAWETLVSRYGRLVYSVPRRYGLDSADCEDVHQNVFIQLYRSLPRLRDHERVASWLITAAHRESWRVGRRRGRPTDLADRFEDLGAPEVEEADRWEQQDLVHRGLGQLGERCRELLVALFLDPEGGYRAVAARLGIPVGSIGPTRARCFEQLREILEGMGVRAPGEDPED